MGLSYYTVLLWLGPGGLACCKWINESFIAKDLEMAPSLWVVWSSGVTFFATAEVT